MNEDNDMAHPLTPYYGGKSRTYGKTIAQKIELIPHTIYVDGFFGAGGVFMQKRLSKIEVANDLHDGVVNLLRVVRNAVQCKYLLEQLELTPYSRSEWRYCQENWQAETEPVEKARMVYTVLSQNFVGETNGGSWSFGGVKCGYNVARTHFNSLENIKLVAQRLQNVSVECQDVFTVLKRWGEAGQKAVFYLDPPYLPATRSGHAQKTYLHEFSVEQHEKLLDWCVGSKSAVLLSGYNHAMYNDALPGWTRYDHAAVASSMLQSSGNGQKNRPTDKSKRIECLWLNPLAQSYQASSLFDYAGLLGQ